MSRYQVKVHSCKKDTNVAYDFSEDEARLMQHIAYLTQQESKSECQPTIIVTEIKTRRPGKVISGIRFYKDGDQWCAVHDDTFVDLATSPAGFGEKPQDALIALVKDQLLQLTTNADDKVESL